MTHSLEFSCDCGAFRAELTNISPRTTSRIVCYCTDCQGFVHYLGKQETGLDAQGGSDICHALPENYHIKQGRENLQALQFKPTRVLRWYADCCQSMVAATLSSRALPFLGLPLNGFDASTLHDRFGPPRAYRYRHRAHGDQNAIPIGKSAPHVIAPIFSRLIGAVLRGNTKSNPFFDAQTGAPIAAPHKLTKSAYEALEADVLKNKEVR